MTLKSTQSQMIHVTNNYDELTISTQVMPNKHYSMNTGGPEENGN